MPKGSYICKKYHSGNICCLSTIPKIQNFHYKVSFFYTSFILVFTCLTNCNISAIFRSDDLVPHCGNENITEQSVSQKTNAGLSDDLEESYVDESFVREKFDQLLPSKYTQESSSTIKFSVSSHLVFFLHFFRISPMIVIL